MPAYLHKFEQAIIWEVTVMNQKTNHVKSKEERYTVERCFWGMRTAEEVVAALVKAHR